MRRIVTSICLALLSSGTASAAEDKAGDAKCTEQLIQAEALVYGKIKANALTEAKAEEITALLDEADALCTVGKYEKAAATMTKVERMVAKASDEASNQTPDKAEE
jgi:hypothetical protein